MPAITRPKMGYAGGTVVQRGPSQMKNCRTIGVRPAVSHSDGTNLAGRRHRVVGDTVARATGAIAKGVPTLDEEVLDDAVEEEPVIEALTREEDEVIHGERCAHRVELDHDVPQAGPDCGNVRPGQIDRHRGR